MRRTAPGPVRKGFALFFGLALPGSGQVVMGRLVRGGMLFSLFLVGANGMVLGLYWYHPRLGAFLSSLFGLATGLVWLFAAWDVWVLTFGTNRDTLTARRLEGFRQAMTAELMGDIAGAIATLEEVARLDVDRCDPDVHLHLARLARLEGRIADARRHLRQAMLKDRWGGWALPIQQEWERLP